MKRTNAAWLEDLQGPDQDQAIEELRTILIRGLHFALSNRLRDDIDALIEDFVQDALIKIIDKLYTFRGESQFTTWAQKITVRVAFTELRRKRWKDISIEDLLPEDSGTDFTPAILTDSNATPEQKVTQNLILERILQVIHDDLTDRQRDAMLAVMAGGMPLEEVARRMGTNRNALYKLIHDARKHLKQQLLEEGLSMDEILSAFNIS